MQFRLTDKEIKQAIKDWIKKEYKADETDYIEVYLTCSHQSSNRKYIAKVKVTHNKIFKLKIKR
jgi:hypothetical protein